MPVCSSHRTAIAPEDVPDLPGPDGHRGNQLGSEALTYAKLASQLSQGSELYSTTLKEGFSWDDYRALHGDRATLLFVRDDSGWVHVVTPDSTLKPSAGWTLLALIQTESE